MALEDDLVCAAALLGVHGVEAEVVHDQEIDRGQEAQFLLVRSP